MSKKQSLGYQMQGQIKAMYRPSTSKLAIVSNAYNDPKYEGKSKIEIKNEAIRPYIFSEQTKKTYMKEIKEFAKFCKEQGVRTIPEARNYVDEYLKKNIAEGKSAYTISTKAAALGKLYQEPMTNFTAIPKRARSEITRSREARPSDRHFSEKRNKALVEFCKGTGLRRHELQGLKRENLVTKDGNYYLEIKGKGGKVRTSPIIGSHRDEIIKKVLNTPSGQKVWGRVNQHADIHSYRSVYANDLYKSLERDLSKLDRKELYICKKDKAGLVLDRNAMQEVSKALGHSRIEVFASNYLREE